MTNQRPYSNTLYAMGTRFNIVIPDIGMDEGDFLFEIIKSEIQRQEFRMSRFIADSPVSALNNAKADIWVPVPDELWEILDLCYKFFRLSEGLFDITAGSLIKLWKDQSETDAISIEEIQQAKAISGFHRIEMDKEKHTIRKEVDGLEFDLGGIGKGIALDGIHDLLGKQGIANALLSFGESSVLALGNHPQGDYWPIGICDPFNPKEYLHVFSAKDQVVTTSSTMMNKANSAGEKRAHIVNPLSGEPVNSLKTISVLSKSATVGEFLSTLWLLKTESSQKTLPWKPEEAEIVQIDYDSHSRCRCTMY